MKKCTIGLFSKIITFLVFAVFFIPLTGICFYIAFLYPQAAQEERLIFLVGVFMFGGLVAFAVYRTFYLGLAWTEYDMENVIFHYSRKEEHRFQWEEIPGNRIQAERAGGGYVFCIRENGRQRKIPLNRLSKGYKDFEKFEQYQKYREVHPGSTPPKPEGDCIICPDCQGKGLHLKKLPLLKVDVGKVCKTCGGSGYVPAHVSDFVHIPAENMIKESRTKNPDYCDKQYIVYISPCALSKKIRVNTYYLLQGDKVRICTHYDRGLCDTLEEYHKLPIEYVEEQAYGSWMDGAR